MKLRVLRSIKFLRHKYPIFRYIIYYHVCRAIGAISFYSELWFTRVLDCCKDDHKIGKHARKYLGIFFYANCLLFSRYHF